MLRSAAPLFKTRACHRGGTFHEALRLPRKRRSARQNDILLLNNAHTSDACRKKNGSKKLELVGVTQHISFLGISSDTCSRFCREVLESRFAQFVTKKTPVTPSGARILCEAVPIRTGRNLQVVFSCKQASKRAHTHTLQMVSMLLLLC